MNDNAELSARRWLAEQLAWERRFEELREAAGIEGAEVTEVAPRSHRRLTNQSSPDEPVAHAGFGDQVPRMARLGFELAAELRKVEAQVVGLGLVRGTPDLLQQLPLADELAGMAHEHLEDMPFGRREVHDLTVPAHLSVGEVDGEVRRLDGRLPPPLASCGASAARRRASSSSIPNGLVT